MKSGDVVTIAFPQSDGQKKQRPAILIKEILPFGDWLICPVSTQLRHEVPGLDIFINISRPDAAGTGLKKDSIIRTANLYTVPKQEIRGAIGVLNPQKFEMLIHQLTTWLDSELSEGSK